MRKPVRMAGRERDDQWRFDRAVARVDPVIEEVVAEHATAYVGRPVQRHVVRPPRPLPGITWSIEGALVVEYVHRPGGRDQVLVHDVALLQVLKKRIRSGHVQVGYAETTWDEGPP
jgi:hypothetical protein